MVDNRGFFRGGRYRTRTYDLPHVKLSHQGVQAALAPGWEQAVLHSGNCLLHNFHVWMRIPGGGVDVRVTQKLLHNAHIGAGFQREGSEGMAAGMRRKLPYFRVLIPQRREEAGVISGKIPGMPNGACSCSENELPATGKAMYQVGHFGHERQRAQALGCLGYVVLNLSFAADLENATPDG